ncbi:MAG: ROK family protein [Gammaproteobacteria bacterium]
MKIENQPSDAGLEWLFADIGGTNARFCRWRRSTGCAATRRSPADAFESLADAVRDFEQNQPARVAHAALAVALPVRKEPTQMTNRRWTLDVPELRRSLDLEALHVVNDFVAAAAGVPSLGDDGAHTLREGSARSANLLVIGPGTGLGTAALLDVGTPDERVVASEGGHMTFAWHDAALDALCNKARARWGHVSWERLLSGSGLGMLYAWQAGGGTALPAPEVSWRAAQGEPAARRAVTWFSRLLGACAGDLCLAFGADGGVWLTGGVLDGLDEGFDAAAFLEAFDDKGRHGPRQARVPVKRVLAGDLAFRGLARITEGACRAPGLLATAEGVEEHY